MYYSSINLFYRILRLNRQKEASWVSPFSWLSSCLFVLTVVDWKEEKKTMREEERGGFRSWHQERGRKGFVGVEGKKDWFFISNEVYEGWFSLLIQCQREQSTPSFQYSLLPPLSSYLLFEPPSLSVSLHIFLLHLIFYTFSISIMGVV